MICPWPIDFNDCPGCREPANADRLAAIAAQVTTMLSRWSGFAYGGCRTVRPLDPCGECRTGCCASGDCIVLHDASGVTEVRIDGVVVPPEDYHFSAARGTLCAVPPLRWPTRDNLYSPVGTLEVDVRVGAEPDAWALAVASELACELWKSCAGDKSCRLPKNVTRITAQNVTVELTQDEAKYALPAVAAWVNTVNPARAVVPARIFSPEADRARATGARRSARFR